MRTHQKHDYCCYKRTPNKFHTSVITRSKAFRQQNIFVALGMITIEVNTVVQ